MPKVLVVDDQRSVCTALTMLFRLHGIETVVAATPREALEAIREDEISVVVQDMNFTRDATSGDEGVELMKAIRALDPNLPIVLMTAFTSLEMAVRVVKQGADDYVAKPWHDDKLVTTVKNLVRMRQLELENTRLLAWNARARHQLGSKYDLCDILYESPCMHDVVSLAVRVAAADVPVLIMGPNGSGKEKIAEIIQKNSRRRGRPLVTVNAGALPDSLLESELFGAEAGAYTGAVRNRVGRFEEADGGTLFLDEIGNLSAQGQMRLLRVLQTGEIQRLGSNTTRRTDVRVISATNVDLPRAVANHEFREDLYFRLNVIEIVLPPLRERGNDIVLLARRFLQQDARKTGTSPVELSDDAVQALLSHEWPGNVRELSNRIQRAMLVRKDARIGPNDLGLVHSSCSAPTRASARTRMLDATYQDTSAGRGPSTLQSSSAHNDPSTLSANERSATADSGTADGVASESSEHDERERTEIARVLLEANGVISRAAATLGLSRQALYRRIERLGLTVSRTMKRVE